MSNERKELRFEIKAVGEDGTFEGLLATYGNVDLGGDVIEPGAFTKTLNDSGHQRPMLWQHKEDEPIGLLDLTDGPMGLSVKGTLNLDVARAREAYSNLKKRIVKGMSIGFTSIKDSIEGGVRHLKEIRLYEGSVVTFPMNLLAVISSVKAARSTEKKDSFSEELQEIQILSARWQMMQALCCSLDDTVSDQTMSADDKVSSVTSSIQEFQSAYVEVLPAVLALMSDPTESDDSMEMMRAPIAEFKVGAMFSSANRKVMENLISTLDTCKTDLQALLDAADGTSAKSGAATKAAEPDPVVTTQSVQTSDELEEEYAAAFSAISIPTALTQEVSAT